MQVAIPRIVIAGTHSGCGKTTIASGLMAALTESGLRVQPFKTGPDFIDPSHHTVTCNRISRNLDPFMMGEAGVLRMFASASVDADIAVIEGAMGLFDGVDGILPAQPMYRGSSGRRSSLSLMHTRHHGVSTQ
jgi:cobyrinic acid a,c-diamide synthase